MAGLSVKGVEKAKPGRHPDGRGLYLLVKPSGARSWLLRIQVGGKRRDIGLGGFPEVSLANAREKAFKLRSAAKAGGDPIAERDKEKGQAVTFKEAAIACQKARNSGWSDRHAQTFLSTLELHVYPRPRVSGEDPSRAHRDAGRPALAARERILEQRGQPRAAPGGGAGRGSSGHALNDAIPRRGGAPPARAHSPCQP